MNNVISINQYTLFKISIYFIVILILFVSTKKHGILDIKKRISLKYFVKQTLLVVGIGVIGMAIYILRWSASEYLTSWKTVFWIMQYILGVVFEIRLISLWLQCFNSYFKKKFWNYVLVVLWGVNQLIGILPSIIFFLIYTFLGVWILKKQKNN